MCNGHRGTGSRPGLLYAKGVESKGRNEILRGKRDSVGAIAIIRRVDNEGDVIREHFVDIKDNTSISVTTERVPSNDRKRIRGGGREDFNSGRGGARSYTIAEDDLPGLCGTKIDSVGKCIVRQKRY